jgi:hypothetical protein
MLKLLFYFLSKWNNTNFRELEKQFDKEEIFSVMNWAVLLLAVLLVWMCYMMITRN